MEKPNIQIVELLSKVMEDVGAVGKGERNTAQNFNFRGVDAVVNAVSPVLRKYGVVVTPEVVSNEYSTVESGKNRTLMGHCRLTVTYKFWAPDGSYIPSTVSAESMDAGDKATAKAMSVALRTCLLQTLCLPTDDIDPDHQVYERASVEQSQPSRTKPAADRLADRAKQGPSPLTDEQRAQFVMACEKAGLEPATVARNAQLDWETGLTEDDLPALRSAFQELKAFKEGA